MKVKLVVIILFLIIVKTDALGGDDKVIAPLLGITYGGFTPLHPGFDDIYTSTSSPMEYFFGVGYDKIYLIGKFKKFRGSGISITSDENYTGDADYNQEFFMFGLRFYNNTPAKMKYFLEFGAVSSLVEESISTVNRQPELFSKTESQEWGFCIAAGGQFMFSDFVGISGSAEYTRIIYNIEQGVERGDVNLGGFYFSVGIVFMPFSD